MWEFLCGQFSQKITIELGLEHDESIILLVDSPDINIKIIF